MTISPQAQKAASYLMNARFTEREVGCYVQNIINEAAGPLVEALTEIVHMIVPGDQWRSAGVEAVCDIQIGYEQAKRLGNTLARWRKENGG